MKKSQKKRLKIVVMQKSKPFVQILTQNFFSTILRTRLISGLLRS